MATVEGIHGAQRAHGTATVLAIGTATPPTCVDQATYPDFYFRVTASEHKTHLKDKFERICKKSTVKKRYMHLTEEILDSNPSMCQHMAPSLDARQAITVAELPKLGQAAAEKAIKEWGQPKSSITHLVFATSSGITMPSADFHLAGLLSLDPSIKRLMIYQQGCFAGAAALRMAKDLAENNARARVLIVCAEINALMFRGPCDCHMDSLVGQALIGDGAAAVIVGSDPVLPMERALFQLVTANQTIVPDSENAIYGRIGEVGLMYHLGRNVPKLISSNIGEILKEAFQLANVSNWNSIFWVVHPGGPAILDRIEDELALGPEKLRASRDVLREYGNMSSPSVLFVLDEMRKFSAKERLRSTGEGLDWGVLFGFGPGLTIETMVLHSIPIN